MSASSRSRSAWIDDDERFIKIALKGLWGPIEVNGVPTPSKGWVDDVTTDYAIRFIREHRDRPFAMMLGYKATHGPFDPPQRARERFAGEQARPVPNLASRAIYRGPGTKR